MFIAASRCQFVIFSTAYDCCLFIFLSFIGDGQTFVVTWTTLSPTTSSVIGSIVEFGSDPENLENSVHGTEEVFVDGGDEKRKEYIHRVIFPKLTPKKRYCKLQKIIILRFPVPVGKILKG